MISFQIAFYEEVKDIMAKATSEWLTSLHCSFQDNENLYSVWNKYVITIFDNFVNMFFSYRLWNFILEETCCLY